MKPNKSMLYAIKSIPKKYPPIPGFAGYVVTPNGLVYSFWSGQMRELTPHRAKRAGLPHGGPKVSLQDDKGIGRTISVHRLVSMTYGTPHRDGVPEWALDIPGHSGYYITRTGIVYSTRSQVTKILKPSRCKRNGKPTGPTWIALSNGKGVIKQFRLDKLIKEATDKEALGELF